MPEFSERECHYIQAYGLEACKHCSFDYEGEPAIYGGKRIKKLIKGGGFPKLDIQWTV